MAEDTEEELRGKIFKGVLTLSQVAAVIYLVLNANFALVRNTVAIAFVPPLLTWMGIFLYSYLND